MNQVSALGLAVAAFVLSACSSDPPPPEPKGSTESHLSGGAAGGVRDCIDSIDAQAGSADWRAQVQQCVSDAVDSARSGQGGGAVTPPDVPAPSVPNLPNLPNRPDVPNLPDLPSGDDGSGGGSSCTSGIQCVNGSCSCTSGPNQGQACDGSTDSGESSCSVMCSSCN